jgi:hypothetical protein
LGPSGEPERSRTRLWRRTGIRLLHGRLAVVGSNSPPLRTPHGSADPGGNMWQAKKTGRLGRRKTGVPSSSTFPGATIPDRGGRTVPNALLSPHAGAAQRQRDAQAPAAPSRERHPIVARGPGGSPRPRPQQTGAPSSACHSRTLSRQPRRRPDAKAFGPTGGFLLDELAPTRRGLDRPPGAERKLPNLNGIGVREDDRRAQRLFQLPHISWPVVPEDGPPSLRSKRWPRSAVADACALQEMLDEQEDILPPLGGTSTTTSRSRS